MMLLERRTIRLRSKILKIKYLILLNQLTSLLTSLNAKINEIKGEVPDITNLATTAALTTVKNT